VKHGDLDPVNRCRQLAVIIRTRQYVNWGSCMVKLNREDVQSLLEVLLRQFDRNHLPAAGQRQFDGQG